MSDYVLENKSLNDSKTRNFLTIKNIFLIFSFIVIFLLLLAILFYYYVFLPNSSIAKIKFTGNNTLSEVFLRQKIEILEPMKWSAVDSMEIAKSIAKISSVESVSVQKKLPNKVLISITERTPVATTFVQLDDWTVPVLIDKNGVIFSSDEIEVNNFPILSGLEIEKFSEGMKLNFELKALLKNIFILERENSKLLNQISEIKIVPKKYGGYELILFPLGEKVRIRIKDNLNAETIKYALLVVDVVSELKDFSTVREIDLRSGIAVMEKDASL